MALSRRTVQLVGRLHRRKTRAREGLVLVEGPRACAEAVRAGAVVRFAVHAPELTVETEAARVLEHLHARGDRVEEAAPRELAALSGTESPQGILLVCVEPTPDPGSTTSWRRFLVLDGVQDPGNAGTLIRAATAFAMDGVVVLDGTVDPWSPKTVRASAGLVFRVPVVSMDGDTFLDRMASHGPTLLLADARGRPVAAAHPDESWALVIGNEGAGPRDGVRDAAAAAVAVPMSSEVESLNAGVAGAILLYALTRESEGD
ncbi:MAG: RNA methyltransferase [Gemmatimonadota bacterium]|nr:RNA methyltransferase [Gemmatimonadota bacterium]MDH5760281.1 RNA methyltransferase [Gemmatimonadota bacterium]